MGNDSEPLEADKLGLGAATEKAASLKLEIERLETETKAKKEELASTCELIKRTLDLAEIDSIRAHGYLFYKENKTSVSAPKDLDAKRELFKFLEDKGIFLEMVSINSMTLNSLYKSLAEQAMEEGVLDYRMPGVAEPVNYVNLKIRKG